ncbi:MAG: tRNA (adenine-N1)-methyltransferase [Brevinematales bacterium]|jgi:tRNA (adenine57-N1/adenine58-N1)-methyltransferase
MLNKGDFIYIYYDDKVSFMMAYQDNMSVSTHKGELKIPPEADYGDRLLANTGEAFYLLRPVLSDCMMKVKRRTTIIYPKEAGVIILELGISGGKRVIEIGTGSGSLTLLLSRLVGSEGRVYSFERRDEHLENAIKNVKKFSPYDNVEYFMKDPSVEGGFGVENADALFLDVPEPWRLIDEAYKSLIPGGALGVISPNIEQVQTTVYKMNETGFVRVRCMETLSRGIRIKKNLTRPFDRMIGHTGYLYFAHKVKKGITEKAIDYSI